MIQLSRLKGRTFVLNAELIETIEATPDTTITLITGKVVVVAEGVEEVVRRVIDYRSRVGCRLPPHVPSLAGQPSNGESPAR